MHHQIISIINTSMLHATQLPSPALLLFFLPLLPTPPPSPPKLVLPGLARPPPPKLARSLPFPAALLFRLPSPPSGISPVKNEVGKAFGLCGEISVFQSTFAFSSSFVKPASCERKCRRVWARDCLECERCTVLGIDCDAMFLEAWVGTNLIAI
jgi:hypothetical protein